MQYPKKSKYSTTVGTIRKRVLSRYTKARAVKAASLGSNAGARGTYRKLSPQAALSFKDNPFPPTLITRMKYGQALSLTSTAGAVATQNFQSSLFDPDLTGTGHQPRYFDTLFGVSGGGSPYGSYRVRSMYLDISCIPQSALGSSTGYVCIRWRDSATADGVATLTDMREGLQTMFFKCVMPLGCEPSVKRRIYFDVPKLLGLDPQADELEGQWNSNPSRRLIVAVSYCSADGITTTSIGGFATVGFVLEAFGLNYAPQS